MAALPTPDELRAHALRCREAAERETDPKRRNSLARHALALAQLAEQIERRQLVAEPVVEDALESSRQMLGEAARRSAPHAAGHEERPEPADEDALHRARLWRQKAEECRTIAEQMTFRETRATYRRLADNYEAIARREEDASTRAARTGTRDRGFRP